MLRADQPARSVEPALVHRIGQLQARHITGRELCPGLCWQGADGCRSVAALRHTAPVRTRPGLAGARLTDLSASPPAMRKLIDESTLLSRSTQHLLRNS